MFVYLYVCIFIYLYISIFVYLYVCIYACMHACVHGCMYVCMYVCRIEAYMHACNMQRHMHIPIPAHMLTCRPSDVHPCMHAYITGSRTDLIVCLLAYLLACVYNYTHICTYADLCTYLVCGVYCKLLRFVVPRAADREWGMFLPAAYAMPQGVSGSGCRVLSFNRASDPLAVRMSRT